MISAHNRLNAGKQYEQPAHVMIIHSGTDSSVKVHLLLQSLVPGLLHKACISSVKAWHMKPDHSRKAMWKNT